MCEENYKSRSSSGSSSSSSSKEPKIFSDSISELQFQFKLRRAQDNKPGWWPQEANFIQMADHEGPCPGHGSAAKDGTDITT